MSLYRTLWILARTPLVAPESAKQAALGVPLTTFREYSSTPSSSAGRIRSLSTTSALATTPPQEHSETSPAGPNTDEIAHTDEAYNGNQADPETSQKRIEGETGQSMETTAGNTQASSKPSNKGDHDVPGSGSVPRGKPGQKQK